MSPSREDYIKNIFKGIENAGFAQNKDISNYLEVSKPSVTEMIGKLKDDDLVYTENSKIYLTEQGLKIGEKLISIHRLWEKFLEEVLDFPADQVHNQADLLEHVTSDELVKSLNKYLNYPKNCPHGRIIYINAKENI